jgi:predicted membrane-bound mannosyltransferase
MLRNALFIVGCILMFLGLFVPYVLTDGSRFRPTSIFELGLAIAITAHGWPDNLT